MEIIKPTVTEYIYQSLFNYFSDGYMYQMQNVYVFASNWESDFFCLNRDGYCFEMEVKVSRADFRADFKKDKHKLFSGKESPNKLRTPNRFYYVVPKGLVKPEEIPAYAGLIYVENAHATIVKRAPFIHKIKYDFRKKLCDKFYYQWKLLIQENRILSRDKKYLETRLAQRQ